MIQKQLRNFVIISHVDHGKSTLADRFLELTGTIEKRKMQPQFLDMMPLEREKGITIKMQPVRMLYTQNAIPYTLNLIDTPGHIDFSYEVSRSLAAVEGAILLVDATQGIQAQTISNLELARKQNLVIIPVINKIDSPNARIEATKDEISSYLKINKNEILEISAKNGTNVKELLTDLIKKVPPPTTELKKPFRALIFDSKYDSYKGVIAYVRVFDGEIKSGDDVYLMAAKIKGKIKEVGYFKPNLSQLKELKSGEIGYIATGIKEIDKVKVGDTIVDFQSKVEPLIGYKEPKPVVFASLYSQNPENFPLFKNALLKLKLNDASLTFESEDKEILGRGFKCGFLGSLHLEITTERLKREFGLDLIISTPSSVYKIIDENGKVILISSPGQWPDQSKIKEVLEPWAKLEIMTPINFFGNILNLIKSLEGKFIKTKYFGKDKALLIYETPLREIIIDFYDKLKSQTQGFGSMDYKILDYRPADLVKLEILIAGRKEEIFSRIVSKKSVFSVGKKIVKKLKEVLPAQLFAVPLQAVVSGKIIARETIKAKKKDVIAPLYGGDYTRKRKLLEKQKKGKKELKEKGIVNIPQRVYLEILKSD